MYSSYLVSKVFCSAMIMIKVEGCVYREESCINVLIVLKALLILLLKINNDFFFCGSF